MTGEFVHSSVGTSMTQAEFEAVGLHVCNSQATGDLIYASSATQLSRLGIGSTGQVLAVVGGIAAWASSITIDGILSANPITLKPSGDTDDYFTFSTVSDIPTIMATGAAYLDIDSLVTVSQLTTDGHVVCGGSFYFTTSAIGIFAQAANDSYFKAMALDNDVAQVELMRWQSAANPYVQVGRDDTGVAINAVTDMLKLQAGAGTNNEAANFGLGISMLLGNASSEVEERGSIDLVLTDATNASEDVRLNFNLQIAGAAPALVASLTGTGPIFPNLPNADPTVAGMLYYIAATGVVMRSAG